MAKPSVAFVPCLSDTEKLLADFEISMELLLVGFPISGGGGAF